MSRKARRAVVLFVVPLVLYGVLLGVLPLMEPDETRYALIPREMNQTGDYVTPHLKGVVYLEKPPLAYWATALSYRLLGEGEFSSRLFGALCAWGCILLAYAMGRHLYDEETGTFAAAVFSTSLLPFVLGRLNILDMPLTFFVSAALWSAYRYLEERREGTGRGRAYLWGLYLFSAAAFLTKGLVGVVFPFAVGVLWLLWEKRWREVPRLVSPAGILVFLVAAGPWLYLVQAANPDFFHFFFVREHFLRFTTTIHERTEPFYYYFLILLVGTVPWGAYLPRALLAAPGAARDLPASARRYLLSWGGFVFLFFSLSSSKLASYIAPVRGPLAVYLGHVLRAAQGAPYPIFRRQRWAAAAAIPVFLQAAALAAAVFVPLLFDKYRRIGPPAGAFFVLLPLLQVLIVVVSVRGSRRLAGGPFFTVYLSTALFFALALFPAAHWLGPGKSALPTAAAVKRLLPPGETLYQYRLTMYGLDFYGGYPTAIVDDQGELAYGIRFLSPADREARFPGREAFARAVGEGRARFAVTEGKDKVEELRRIRPDLRVLWDNGKFYMVDLRPAVKDGHDGS